MNKSTMKNLLALLILAVAVVVVGHAQRVRRAESLARDLVDVDQNQAYRALKKLAAMGPGAMSKLAPLLKSPEAQVRARAAAVIAETQAATYGPALVELLTDPDEGVRAAVITALGAIGDQSAVPRIVPLLTDKTQPMTVRVAAGRGLAQLASPAAVPALVATLEGTPAQEDAGLRQTVAIALGAIPVPEAVTALCDHLSSYKEPDPEIRALAAEGLALAPRVGSNAAQQAGRTLIGALSDSASEVRIAAAHSLGQMRFSGQLGEWVAQTLRMSQDDPHYWVRVAASEALH